jgi:hypothetical protein
MTKGKKAQFLKELIETIHDYSAGANQEFCNLVSKEVKLSRQSASSQRKKMDPCLHGGEANIATRQFYFHDKQD